MERAQRAVIAATVILSENYSTCSVARGGSNTGGRDVSCRDVGDYLRNVLKLRRGAAILIMPRNKYSSDAQHAMTDQLLASGFGLAPYMGRGISAVSSGGGR